MAACLKYLLPISCFLFLGVTVWPLVVYQATAAAGSPRTTVLPASLPLGDKAMTPGPHVPLLKKSTAHRETGHLDVEVQR
jgi:hypothetical protein